MRQNRILTRLRPLQPRRILSLLLLPLFYGCGPGGETQAPGAFVTIGTGGVTGVYYPVGGVIATLLNDHAGLRASVESTGGSVFNINAVLGGDLDFGIAQADRQYQALNGLEEWSERGGQEQLRSVCSLYTELVTLVAADDAGITTVQDLRGKQVNIGNPGSGSRVNALDALRAAGLDPESDIQAESITSSESAKMLQDDRIDAYFFTVGHPTGSFMEATAGFRKVRFVPIEGMEELIQSAPYYVEAEIDIALYPSALNDSNVPTIGVTTSLITSAAVEEDLVYTVTKVLAEHLDALRAQHPALTNLTLETMPKNSAAPLHPGAERYYREQGVL